MSNDETIAKTIWSDTLIEVLLTALRKNVSDDKVSEIIKEVQQKGFNNDYIISKVTRELDEDAARRVKRLIK